MKERQLAALAFAVLVAHAAASPAQVRTTTTDRPSLTGSVTEEQFKAMHELRKDPAPELHGQMIDLAGGRAYLALPSGARAPLPGIVVIHEWWGLNDYIKNWSDRLADEGYAALAVDLYGGKVATSPDSAMAYVKAVDPQRAKEILLAADAFLAKDPRVQATRRASIGWCFGGGQSLQLALAAPDLAACVMYYGQPVLDPEALKAIRARLLGIFGNLDQSIPPETVTQFDAALTKAGTKHRILRYDAPHAFANPSNPAYNEKATEAAWKEVQKFLAANLKPGRK